MADLDFENDTSVDEEPLFADDLDEYEEQDEEDDPPPLPPPIQGTQSNPLSRLNNNNTVQTTLGAKRPGYAPAGESVSPTICMHDILISRWVGICNFYFIIFHVLGARGYTCNVPYFIDTPSLGQVHFLNPRTIFLISLVGIEFIDSRAGTNVYNIQVMDLILLEPGNETSTTQKRKTG